MYQANEESLGFFLRVCTIVLLMGGLAGTRRWKRRPGTAGWKPTLEWCPSHTGGPREG